MNLGIETPTATLSLPITTIIVMFQPVSIIRLEALQIRMCRYDTVFISYAKRLSFIDSVIVQRWVEI
jgi:hypothetical protein